MIWHRLYLRGSVAGGNSLKAFAAAVQMGIHNDGNC